jgi:glycosyl transferase family 25
MNSINDIKNCYYINLETRPDRKNHVEHQLKTIGVPYKRFKAVKLPDGRVGCSMSHLALLQLAKKEKLPHIMIVEDDIKFLDPILFKNQINKFFSYKIDYDVLLIAGNNLPPFQKTNDSCVKVTTCQTTTGYIVQEHYYDTLIHNIRSSIQKLIQQPDNHIQFAIDKYWFALQRRHNWYLIIPLTVIQREDYSDIEKRATNYGRGMLDLDKIEYFKQQEIIRQRLAQFQNLHM